MLSLWNLHLLLPLWLTLSFHVTVLTGEILKATQRPDTETVAQHLPQSSQEPHGSVLVPGDTMFLNENNDSPDLPQGWSMSSSEEDRQGVIGEYTDTQESSEESLLYRHETGLTTPRPTERANGYATVEESPPPNVTPPQEQTIRYERTETGTFNTNRSLLHPTQNAEDQPTSPTRQSETPDRYFPLFLSGSPPSERPKQEPTSLPSIGPGPNPEHNTQPAATGSWGSTTGPTLNTKAEIAEQTLPVKDNGHGLNVTDGILKGGVVMETEKGASFYFLE